VAVIDLAGERLDQVRVLEPHPTRAIPASTFGLRCPVISASIISRTDSRSIRLATEVILIRASFNSSSGVCRCRVRFRGQVHLQPGVVPHHPDLPGCTNEGRSNPFSVNLASDTPPTHRGPATADSDGQGGNGSAPVPRASE
jgi:hypothetical protein